MKTFTIDWLNKCRCGNKSHTVKTARGNETALWDDDAVKCNSCGRGGVIQVCEGQARVLWETDEEMADGKPMTTITKERLLTIKEWRETYGPGSNVVLPAEEAEELARIALASLEAEPVAWLLSGGGAKNNVSFDSGNAYADPLREVTPLYTVPPAPVSVPAAMEMDDDFDSAFEHGKAVGWNAYRAAMLQAEPVSNSDELPLDYLQGHKDGLEWAAQLAEANHPQTGDWLYDDPIDLARAIRKGPDMPTVQGGNSPVIPDDVRRMDWLVSKTVNVREPMVYGSHSLFWSQTITDEEDDYHATKLREQIDAAMAAEQAAAPQQEAE
ncbi:hypothetical protein MA587_002639 [Escherichia coli]|nr:hypothetical protein [Escherichia coli]